GLDLLKQGDLAKASVEFRSAIQLKPGLTEAEYSLGTVLEQQQNLSGAADQYRDVADRDPKNVDARVHLARILLASNQLDTAKRYADEAFALAQDNAGVLALESAVSLKLGDTFNAVKYGTGALSIDPTNQDALLSLAAERLAAQDPKRALSYLDQ